MDGMNSAVSIKAAYIFERMWLGLHKFETGCIVVTLGGLVLPLELYGLKFIALTELISHIAYRESVFYYLGEPSILWAVLFALAVIAFGVVLMIRGASDKKKTRREPSALE